MIQPVLAIGVIAWEQPGTQQNTISHATMEASAYFARGAHPMINTQLHPIQGVALANNDHWRSFIARNNDRHVPNIWSVFDAQSYLYTEGKWWL